MGILLIPPSVLEACRQIPFQAYFARLLSLPICRGRARSPPHYSSSVLVSVLVPISVHLPWAWVSRVRAGIPDWYSWCAADTLPVSAGNPSWEEGVILAFSWLCCIWTESCLVVGSGFVSHECSPSHRDLFPVAWPQGAKTLSDLGEQPSNS